MLFLFLFFWVFRKFHDSGLAQNHALFLWGFSFGIRRSDMTRSDLFEMADVLSKQPLPRGNRLAILTNAGGPGVLATDALASHGGVVAELSHKTVEALNLVLPSAWSHGNPIDVLGDATAKHYADSLEIVAQVKMGFGF